MNINNRAIRFCLLLLGMFGSISSINASPWNNVPDIPVTPLGNKVAIGCHNCYNSPNDGIYDMTRANKKITNAVKNGANNIGLDIAITSSRQTFCLTHGTCSGNGEPELTDILGNSNLRTSTAMISLEIKSIEITADAMATKLLDTLLAYPEYATSSRPVSIVGTTSKISYLKAIQSRSSDAKYASLKNHVRFSVLFISTNRGGYGSINTFQSRIKTNVFDNGFHGIGLNYKNRDLLGAVAYAKSLGLSVGVFTIPEDFGAELTAALREEVDIITAEYRADLVKDAITRNNALAYLNTSTCNSSSDSTVAYHYNYAGGQGSDAALVDIPETPSQFGTPGLWYDNKGQDRFGCSLDFRSNQGYAHRTIPMGDRDNSSGEGFLVTAYVNFDDLTSIPEGVMAIVNKSQSAGFAIELKKISGTVYLRFGVHVNGAYRYHNYDITNTGVSGSNSINGADGYFLVGAYNGQDGVNFWINNQKSGSGGNYTGTVKANNVDIMIGADPQPSANKDARFFFNGLIQQVSVLSWNKYQKGINTD